MPIQDKDIDEILLQITLMGEHERTEADQRKHLIEEGEEILFKSHCFKSYLKRCEPEFCSYRITGACKYPGELSRFLSLSKDQ